MRAEGTSGVRCGRSSACFLLVVLLARVRGRLFCAEKRPHFSFDPPLAHPQPKRAALLHRHNKLNKLDKLAPPRLSTRPPERKRKAAKGRIFPVGRARKQTASACFLLRLLLLVWPIFGLLFLSCLLAF